VRDWGGMFTIFVGFFISGIGTSFYYSFGVPYLDDNVSKDNSPFALGENHGDRYPRVTADRKNRN
jgi:hypothetical protein